MRIIFVSFYLIISSKAWADAPGNGSFEFLNLGASARQNAMGEAGVALPNDDGYTHLNPAALADLRTQALRFSYSRLLLDIQHGSLGYARPLGETGNWALDLQYLNYGGIPSADSTGAKTGNLSASDRALRLSWALPRPGLSPGASFKLIQETIAPVTASAFALDAGLLYRPQRDYQAASFWRRQLNHLVFATSLRNLGPPAKFESRSEKLPLIFSAGLAHRSWADSLNIALDAEKAAWVRQALVFRLGTEYWVKDVVALRLGLRSDQDIGQGVSWGVGIKTGEALIDYALRNFGELGWIHQVSFSMRFGGGMVDNYYQQGLHELKQGRYPEAMLLFNKALILDPGNRKVIEKAVEAAEGLEKEEGKQN